MPPKKRPYRSGYKSEHPYPNRRGFLPPSHGCGPRCKVEYDPNNDGPWIPLQIMRIDSDAVENYACAMPRHYAIPLILINKQLAFYEAQCHSDGTPLPSSSNCSIKQRDLQEYSYLWRLRCRFLQAIFDMNHQRCLNERWRYDGIHGFLHRMYRRFGHDTHQRLAYWREEMKEGRVPYTAPDIAEMDWEAYLREDMATSTRINAFLWNRVSQGYSRVVKDEPPFEGWRAWRVGHRDHKLVPYLTPTSSPSPAGEPPSELDGSTAAAVSVADQTTQGSSLNRGGRAGGDCESTAIRTVTAPASTSSSSSSSTLISHLGGGVGGNGDGDEEAEEFEFEFSEEVPTAALTGPPNLQGWTLFPSVRPKQPQSQSSEGSTNTTSWSASTSGQEHLRSIQVSFELNAREDMELAGVQCIFTRTEDIKNKPKLKPKLKLVYPRAEESYTVPQD